MFMDLLLPGLSGQQGAGGSLQLGERWLYLWVSGKNCRIAEAGPISPTICSLICYTSTSQYLPGLKASLGVGVLVTSQIGQREESAMSQYISVAGMTRPQRAQAKV